MFVTQMLTVKKHVSLPTVFVAAQFTVVVPTPNTLPDGGAQVTTGVGMPEAVAIHEMARVPVPLATFVVILPGQVMVGGTASVKAFAGAKGPPVKAVSMACTLQKYCGACGRLVKGLLGAEAVPALTAPRRIT